MNLIKTLYDIYEYAEQTQMIDKLDYISKDIILPLYHNSMRADGKNILNILLDKNSDIKATEFLSEGEVIVFPVTEDSVARSSGVAPHPLADYGEYLLSAYSKKHEPYMAALKKWVNFADNDFLTIIYNFLLQRDNFSKILKSLFNDCDYHLVNPLEAEGQDIETNKSKKYDFRKIFISFTIEDYAEKRDVSITANKKLHKHYIKYYEEKCKADVTKEKISCSISGKEDFKCDKHRPLIVNARLISQITAKNENFRGRFKAPSATIAIGQDTSQKINLMAKYLLQSKKTARRLGNTATLVSWFSDDIQNNSELDLSVSPIFSKSEEKDDFFTEEELTPDIGNEESENIVQSFITGKQQFSDDAEYYVAIFDQVNKGRVAVKYFNRLKSSDLKERLKKWQASYHWATFDKKHFQQILKTPAIRNIIEAAYGHEEGNFLKLSTQKNEFLQVQYQLILTSLIEGRKIPSNIKKALTINIRNRQNYQATWDTLKFVALAVLKEEEGIENIMLKEDRQDRSYLFGRLLALYEILEENCYEKGSERNTNAKKLWSAFVNRPFTTNARLRTLLIPYAMKMETSNQKRGIYFKISKTIEEVTSTLDEKCDCTTAEINKPLSAAFIFGYDSQKRAIFSKKVEGDVDNDRQ